MSNNGTVTVTFPNGNKADYEGIAALRSTTSFYMLAQDKPLIAEVETTGGTYRFEFKSFDELKRKMYDKYSETESKTLALALGINVQAQSIKPFLKEDRIGIENG